MNCFVFSKLYYCSTVWSNTSKHNINKLHLVQNFAARVVLGLKKFDHSSQAIKSLNWLPVNDRIYLNDAAMMYKSINKLVPDYLFEKFTLRSQIHTRNTRQRDQLNIPRCRLTTRQRSFTYRGAKLWNNLRDNVKSSDSVKKNCQPTFLWSIYKFVNSEWSIVFHLFFNVYLFNIYFIYLFGNLFRYFSWLVAL